MLAQTKSQPFLSVIIPSFNEIKNLRRNVLTDVLNYLKKQDYTWELILSDDGSTDGTVAELTALQKNNANIQVLTNEHAGKGPTVQSGMLAAKGEWRLFTDFDQSTPIAEFEKLLRQTPQFSIVIGSREIAGALRDKEPFHRHVMGKIFNRVVQLLAVSGIMDTQCGFKLFSAEATEKLFSCLVVYGKQRKYADAFTGAFDVEILFLAKKYGYQIKEVPILWKHYHTDRVSPIKDSLRMVRDLLRIRLQDVLGAY